MTLPEGVEQVFPNTVILLMNFYVSQFSFILERENNETKTQTIRTPVLSAMEQR